MVVRKLPALCLVVAILAAPETTTTTLAFVPSTRQNAVRPAAAAIASNPLNPVQKQAVQLNTRNSIPESSSRPVSTTRIQASNIDSNSGEDDDSPSSWTLNPVFATAWLALVVFAFGLAPGDLSDSSALLEPILADPVHPAGVNEAFYALFNVFAPLPVILAALVLPQGRPGGRGLPAGPFVAGAAFLGFFALGPYLSLRAPPRDSVLNDDNDDASGGEPAVSWVTRLLENKVVSWSTLALLLYLPLACGLLPDKWADPATWDGFWQLLATSRFACVSAADLALLHTSAAFLIAQDYRLRVVVPDDDDDDSADGTAASTKIAAAAFLFPFVGPALYCALRPPLPGSAQEE